jgi:N-acetylmuramoyl-L-alanine amidase
MAYDRAFAAVTTYCEASSATPDERRDVMHSYFNRLRHGGFGHTIAEVCLRRHQYSEWNGDAVNNANLMRGMRAPDDDPIMVDCGAAFDEVAAANSDPTNGATHYHDKSIAPPYWALPPAIKTLDTAKFCFYKNVP